MKRLLLLAQGSLGAEVASTLQEEGRAVSVWNADSDAEWDEAALSRTFDRSAPDVAAVALSHPNPALLARINRIAYGKGLRWTVGTLDATLVEIGPTVIPGETACYECFFHRLMVNSGLAPLLSARARFYDENRQWSFRGEIPGLHALAAGLLAAEVAQLLEGSFSLARGTYMYLDVLRQAHGRHKISRVPWCATCCQVEDPVRWSAERLRESLGRVREEDVGRSADSHSQS